MSMPDHSKEPESDTSCNASTKKHHVLMVAFRAQGHINPLLRLGKLFLSKGLQVTLATTESAQRQILNRLTTTTTPTSGGAAATATNSVSGVRIESFADGSNQLDEGNANFDVDKYLETLVKFGPINLSKLIEELREKGVPKFTCIINNPFVPWVADVAAKHGIPCAMLWIQPCALFSIYYRFYNNLSPFPSLEGPDEITTVDLPGLPLLRTVDLPSFVLPSNPFRSFSKILCQALQNTHKIKWVLANSFYELESKVIDSVTPLVPIKPVGPLVPPSVLVEHHDDGFQSNDESGTDMWKADEDCLRWLDQMPPRSVIYISYGSVAVLPKESMESIAVALKNTKRPFLWVAKPPDQNAPEGRNQVPEGFEEETREQGRVVNWCPQGLVLSHPSLACFLTHCGWNSVLESLCAGVPLICYPQWTDQPTNAKVVVDVFEVGVRLWPKKDGVVESGEVERCIEEVMVGPDAARMRNKAAWWKRAANEAVANGGPSDRNIQWFVDEVVKISS